MTKKIISILLILSGLCAYAGPGDRGKELYEKGKYEEALKELEVVVGKNPKDATVNYYLGATYYKLGYYKAALKYLEVPAKANWSAAARDMAEINLITYNLDAASDNIDRWEEILDKAKKPYPAELEEMRDRILMARNMLDRVEKIEIIQTFDVDSAEFFKLYRLSPDAGELLDGTMLQDEYALAEPRVVYLPQDAKEIFWGMPDGKGGHQIVVSDILDDGSMTEPRSLGDEINASGDADYPFVLDDGVTIYYGAKGEDSLGGYDIFMTRRSPTGEVLQPQNIGMPYNSLYNDFMMVIDEANNIGWWASDRNRIPGKVTIYAFVPSKNRVNYRPSDPKIADYALLKDITVTDDLDQRLSVPKDDGHIDNDEFYFPLGNGKVYTNISQMRTTQGRRVMKGLLERQADLEVLKAQLEDLRSAYAKGDKKVASQIRELETRIPQAEKAIHDLSNQIIEVETR